MPAQPQPPHAVFGTALEESLEVAQIANLPAIVFRCIQYLEVKKADQEEGIYRLSGSSAVIKSLKDRFNSGTFCASLACYWRIQSLVQTDPQKGMLIYSLRMSTGIPTLSQGCSRRLCVNFLRAS